MIKQATKGKASCFVSFTAADTGSWGQQPKQADPDTPLASYFHQHVQGGHQDTPKVAERYNLSNLSLVCPRVSSRMGMPKTPPQGYVKEAS